MDYGIRLLFDEFSLTINFIIFLSLALLIWLAGTRLSYLIDAIAEQTKIARAFLGLVLLATATELPEFVTTLTATTQGTPSLALNNMFGGMLLQLFVLAIADMFVKEGTLASRPHKPTVAIAGLLCITSLSIIMVAKIMGDQTFAFHVGIGSTSVALLYMASMYILWQMENRETWSPVDLPENKIAEQERQNRYDEKSLLYLIIFSVICAGVILVCGVLLVRLADTLSEQTGLGTSFIGATLLALTTSLPELSTSIAAIRVKAYTMAISNIFGSNMIMTFLLFPNDLAFTQGSIINEIDEPATFALVIGIFMTSLYCIALLARPKVKLCGMGLGSIGILAAYFASVMGMYYLR